MLTAQADQPGILSGSVAHPFLSTRSAPPSLNGFQGSRAVLLADRLHGPPIQAVALHLIVRLQIEHFHALTCCTCNSGRTGGGAVFASPTRLGLIPWENGFTR